jgi:hypothetical protein
MNEYSFIILKEGQPITADLLKEKLPPDTPIDELVTYLKQNKVCKKRMVNVRTWGWLSGDSICCAFSQSIMM